MRISGHIKSSGFSHDLVLRIIKTINLIAMTAIFAIIWTAHYGPNLYSEVFYRRGYWAVAALFAFLYYKFGRTYDVFHISYNRVTEMVYSHGLALLLTDFVMLIITWLLIRHLPSIWPILTILVLQMIFALVWCVLARRWYFHTFAAKRSLIIYDMREGMEDLISEYGMDQKFNVKEIVQINNAIENLDMLDQYEVVFFCGIHSHDRNIILKK